MNPHRCCEKLLLKLDAKLGKSFDCINCLVHFEELVLGVEIVAYYCQSSIIICKMQNLKINMPANVTKIYQ